MALRSSESELLRVGGGGGGGGGVVAQLCPTLCDLIDYSPPGSSVHGILQARILEWVTVPSSRRSSRPRDESVSLKSTCIGRWILYH